MSIRHFPLVTQPPISSEKYDGYFWISSLEIFHYRLIQCHFTNKINIKLGLCDHAFLQRNKSKELCNLLCNTEIISPQILRGASSSSRIGCCRNSSLDLRHRPLTSASVIWTVLPGRLPRTEIKLHQKHTFIFKFEWLTQFDTLVTKMFQFWD